jgi:hypothetical protein
VLWRFWVAVVVGFVFTLAAAPAALASDVLLSGGTLTAGQFLTSADGHYELDMQGDGNLVLYVLNGPSTPRTVWQSGTAGDTGDRAVLEGNGNLVLIDAAGQTLWSTNKTASGCTNLKLQDDGNLVLYTAASAYWATGTVNHGMAPGDRLMPGEAIFAPGEQYELSMQIDGNLVLYGPGGAAWSSGTSKQPGNYAIMRTNGDLVVVNSSGSTDRWISGTYNNPGARLKMLSSGNVEITSGGTTIWQTKTGSPATGPTRFQRPAFTPCPAPPPPPPSPPPSPPQGPVVSVPVKSPLPKLRVRMTMDWTWNRATTRLHRITLRRFPRRATLIFGCHGKGCPRRATKSDWRHLRGVIRSLDGRRYRAGDKLLITVWERGYRSELVGVQIRWGALPKVNLLR